MNEITVKVEKLYTKTEYSKAFGISFPTLNKKLQTKEIKSIKIKGAVIVIAA